MCNGSSYAVIWCGRYVERAKLCLHMVRRFCDWPRLPGWTKHTLLWTVVIFNPTHTSRPGWAARLNLTQIEAAGSEPRMTLNVLNTSNCA